VEEQNLPVTVDATVLPSSTLAIVSLVAGLLGFTFVPLVGGIVALITGYLARNETRSIPPKAFGDGLATAGIILGWVQLGLFVIGICCVMAALAFGVLGAAHR
jgi:hypothetical protein